jgi:MutS domain V
MPRLENLLWAARAIRATLGPDAEETTSPVVHDGKSSADASGQAQDRVISEYQGRIGQLQRTRTQFTRARANFLRYGLAFCLTAAVLLALSLALSLFPVWCSALPLVPGVLSIEKARRCRTRSHDAATLLDFYQRRLARVRYEWMAKGDGGSDLEMPDHLSNRDLDLFGDGSMFELLCDVDTPVGRETLARWLQSPASAEEVISRQEAVRFLRDRTALPEHLALLREGDASEYSWNTLREWLDGDQVALPSWAPWAGLSLSLVMITVGACWGAGLVPAMSALWLMAAIGFSEGALVLALRNRTRSILAGLHLPARKVESLRRLCTLVQGELFECPRLVSLQRKLQGASERIAQLQRLVHLLDFRNNDWLQFPFLLFLGTTQTTMLIEKWRQRNGRELVEWLAAVGEFEALTAIAAYAYENPDDPFPELTNDSPRFEATALGHPLMDRQRCVCNDLTLHADTRFLLVTGSNMSGKSTLLRAVGLNATLAWMGAPVRAARLRISRLQVCASIRIQDSLLDGSSHFYAEIRRLKAMLDLTRSGQPILFLIDELFAGTNSADRRIAAEAVIRSLGRHRSIGLVTSHDLALGEIGEAPDLKGMNMHFTDLATADGQLQFDYRIHAGKLEHGNALKISGFLTLPSTIPNGLSPASVAESQMPSRGIIPQSGRAPGIALNPCAFRPRW